ncbi:ankyrin repeat domain-containing protein [Candidatus Dependentiae bacterium]
MSKIKKMRHNILFFRSIVVPLIIFLSFSSKLFAANIKERNKKKKIHKYVINNRFKALKKLLNDYPETIKLRDKFGKTPVCLAFCKNNEFLARFLLQNSISSFITRYCTDKIVEKEDIYYTTPLYWACFHNNITLFTFLVPQLDSSIVNLVCIDGFTPFLLACSHGNFQMFHKLLPYCDEKTIHDPKCIERALEKKNNKMVRILLENGVKNEQYISKNYINTIKKRKIRNYLVAALHYELRDKKKKIEFLKSMGESDKRIRKNIFNFLARRCFSQSVSWAIENKRALRASLFFKLFDTIEASLFKKVFESLPIIYVNKCDKYGDTLLSFLVSKSLCDKSVLMLIKRILPYCKISANTPNIFGRTPLAMACIKNNLEAFKLLLPYCNHSTINKRDCKNLSPLGYAIKNDNFEMVQILLENNALPASIIPKNKNENCWRKSQSKIRNFLCKNIKRIEETKNKKIKLYIQAVKEYGVHGLSENNLKSLFLGKKEQRSLGKFIIKICFSRSIKEVLDGKKTFQATTFFKFYDYVLKSFNFELLLTLKEAFDIPPVAVLNQSDALGRTSLSILLWNGFLNKHVINIVELILPYCNKETITMPNKEGQTPLYLASVLRNKKLIKYIVQKGGLGCINQLDIFGLTPLHWACYYNKFKIVKYMINLGIVTQETINKSDKNGETPLYFACLHDNNILVDLLLKNGAGKSITKTNKRGKNPLYWAWKNNNHKMVKLLRKYKNKDYIEFSK